MAITQFLHSAIVVKNLERSAQFYGTLLGLPRLDRPLTFPGLWYGVGPYQLHLIQGDPQVPDLREAWGRHDHLALAVDDLAVYYDRLVTAGYPVQTSASGRSALFTQDPDGHVIELTQLPSTSPSSPS